MNKSLLDHTKLYIVGVSGGSDSMYLLDNLYKDHYHIIVAHVNYHYRYDSDEDYQLVRDYCYQYAIPFYYREFFKKDYDQGNFEDIARKLRYQFYLEIYNQYHCDGVVLGHHLDDQLETIYMQLERHHTSHYLGMREVNEVYGMKIIRPMLKDEYKEDIILKCHRYGIPYRDDYTNFETDFFRDKVRNRVLKYYSYDEKMALLDKANNHNQRIDKLMEKVKPIYDLYKNNGKIDYHLLDHEWEELFFYLMLKDVMDTQLISSSLITEIKHQVHSSLPNIQMNLPVNYLFIKEYDNIYVMSDKNMNGYCYQIEEGVSFSCPFFHLADHGHIHEGICLKQDDYPLTIRTMKQGDRIVTSGGTKKVSRLFINAKVPSLQRKTWPIVLNKDQTIVLIPHIAKNIDYLTTKPNVFVIK